MPTHGSLTKAGKVRNQTPKIKSTKKKKSGPRRRNRQNYKNRILEGGNRRRSFRGRRRG